MDFDVIYASHKKRLDEGEAKARECREKLQSYLSDQRSQTSSAVDRTGGKVRFSNFPMSSSEKEDVEFSWQFSDGSRRHYDRDNELILALRAKFSWSPSNPSVIHTSGTDIIEDDMDIEAFIQSDLTEHMIVLMAEALSAQVRKKFPHIDD